MTDDALLPVFVDNAIFGDRRPVSPFAAHQAIINHCLLIDPDAGAVPSLALRLQASQSLAFLQTVEDFMNGNAHYRAESSDKRRLRACEQLIVALRAVAEPRQEEARQAADDAEQMSRRQDRDRGDEHQAASDARDAA